MDGSDRSGTSPATTYSVFTAEWNTEWAQTIALAGAEYVARHTPPGARPVPSEAVEKAVAEIAAAGEAQDRRRFRLAVRAWVDASLAPFEDSAASSG